MFKKWYLFTFINVIDYEAYQFVSYDLTEFFKVHSMKKFYLINQVKLTRKQVKFLKKEIIKIGETVG